MYSKSMYSSSDLKGLKIKHHGHQFEVGEEVILTLSDTAILSTDEYGKVTGINNDDDQDVLENVNLAENDRRIQREKQIKRNRLPVYTAWDDDEFDENNVSNTNGKITLGNARPVLSQYDKQKKTVGKLEIGPNGNIASQLLSNKEHSTNHGGFREETLKMELKPMSDFYTTKEYNQIIQTRSIKDKSKKKFRKKEESMVDVEDEERIESMDDILMNVVSTIENPNEANKSNPSSKSLTELELLALEESRRRQMYESAIKNSINKSTVAASSVDTLPSRAHHPPRKPIVPILLNLKPAAPKVIQPKEVPEVIDFDDEDPEMTAALEKARKFSLRQQSAAVNGLGEGMDHGAEYILQRCNDIESKVDSSSTAMDTVLEGTTSGDMGENIDAEGRRVSDGKLIFNRTTEFTARLQANLMEQARDRAEAVVKDQERRQGGVDRKAAVDLLMDESNGPSKASTIGVKQEKSSGIVFKMVKDDDDEEEEDGNNAERRANEWEMNEDDDDDEEGQELDTDKDGSLVDDGQLDFVHHQPLVAKGMAATLALLKGTGELKSGSELAGRAKDSRNLDPSSEDYGVKLEYRDKLGRKLTQKQAFRELSYKFHGFGPGKKKIEKRMKAEKLKKKAAVTRGLSEGITGTMSSLTKAQEATGRAHFTVQGGASNSATATNQIVEILAKKKKII